MVDGLLEYAALSPLFHKAILQTLVLEWTSKSCPHKYA